MGDRTPGVLGAEPLPTGGTADHDGFVPPDVGLGDPRPIGLDSGAGTAASLNQTGWPRTLTWSDFPEVSSRPSAADEDAQIHCEVSQPERVSVTREGGQFRVTALTVNITILREDSWVVTSQKTASLLSHEQGHYDITGLMGRDMGNEILAARARTVDGLQEQVTRIIERYRQRSQELNDLYDTQTNHSRNRDAQARWDERIRASMTNGTRFSAP
jgi:hypothetical protein